MQQPKRGRRVNYIPVRKELGGRSNSDIISCYTIEFRDNILEKHILGHVSHAIHAFVNTIDDYRNNHHDALKFKLVLKAVFEKATDPEVVTDPAVVLHTENIEVYQATNILEELENAEEQVCRYIFIRFYNLLFINLYTSCNYILYM